MASTGVGGAALTRLHSSFNGLFVTVSAALLVAGYILSVHRSASRGAGVAYLIATMLVAAASMWPWPPKVTGWGTILLSGVLAVATLLAMTRRTAKGHGLQGALILHVSGMT